MNLSSAQQPPHLQGTEHPKPPWSFEHSKTKRLRSASHAAGAGFQPWRLFRDLRPEHALDVRRLWQMVLIWAAAALVLMHVALGMILVPPWAPWYRTATPGEWLSAVLWPHGTTVHDLVHYALRPLAMAAIHGVLPMVLMAAGVLAMARVAGRALPPGALKRAVAYGMASGFIVTCAFFVLPYAVSAAPWPEPVILLYLAVLYGYPLWLGVYWIYFARRAAGLSWPALRTLPVLLVVVIATAATAVLFNQTIRTVYPSDSEIFDAYIEKQLEVYRERRNQQH